MVRSSVQYALRSSDHRGSPYFRHFCQWPEQNPLAIDTEQHPSTEHAVGFLDSFFPSGSPYFLNLYRCAQQYPDEACFDPHPFTEQPIRSCLTGREASGVPVLRHLAQCAAHQPRALTGLPHPSILHKDLSATRTSAVRLVRAHCGVLPPGAPDHFMTRHQENPPDTELYTDNSQLGRLAHPLGADIAIHC